MMEMSTEGLLSNACVIHINDVPTPSDLCRLYKYLYSTDIVAFKYGVFGTCTCHLMSAIFLRYRI